MAKGFIGNFGGFRARFVRSGDAYDFNNRGNAVIFDSEFAGTAGIYTSGVWSGKIPVDRTRIVSWPNPGYVPMVTACVKQVGQVQYKATYNIPLMGGSEFSFDQDGIWVVLRMQPYINNGNNQNPTLEIRYTVYRMRVYG